MSIPTIPDLQALWTVTQDLLNQARGASVAEERLALSALAQAHATAMQAGVLYLSDVMKV